MIAIQPPALELQDLKDLIYQTLCEHEQLEIVGMVEKLKWFEPLAKRMELLIQRPWGPAQMLVSWRRRLKSMVPTQTLSR